jgi:hypothetical protein
MICRLSFLSTIVLFHLFNDFSKFEAMNTSSGEKKQHFVKIIVLILTGFVYESNEFTGLENGRAVPDAGILGNIGAEEVGQNNQHTNGFVYVRPKRTCCHTRFYPLIL